MIQLIDFLVLRTFDHYEAADFTNERSVVSNFHLLVMGGDPINGLWIHNVLEAGQSSRWYDHRTENKMVSSWDSNHTSSAIRADVLSQLDWRDILISV